MCRIALLLFLAPVTFLRPLDAPFGTILVAMPIHLGTQQVRGRVLQKYYISLSQYKGNSPRVASAIGVSARIIDIECVPPQPKLNYFSPLFCAATAAGALGSGAKSWRILRFSFRWLISATANGKVSEEM